MDRRGVPFIEHAKDTYQTDHPSYNQAIDTHNSTWISGVYYLSCVKREGGAVLGEESGFYYFNNSEGANQGQMMTGRQTVESGGEMYEEIPDSISLPLPISALFFLTDFRRSIYV